MQNSSAQWFIITAIGGKEDSIVESLVEKIRNFGYEDHVKEIKIFKENKIKEDVFSKDDPSLPKTMKNTKTTKWETLPDGRYKRIKIKVVNKFPGYIFINMIMDQNIWYTIRNTNGVMGFVGSSGKGAMPIPITIEEFEAVTERKQEEQVQQSEQSHSEQPTVAPKQVYETNLRIGDTVQITVGPFAGTCGDIKAIDLDKGTASVEVEFFGRATTIDAAFTDLKID